MTINFNKHSIELTSTEMKDAMTYHEASLICDNVLKIDSREQRAIDLKKRIACLA